MTDQHSLDAFNALAAQINAKLDALNARLDRMDARAAAMEDPTLRDLPWDPTWPEPPPLPEGKSRWVNRGCGFDAYVPTENRIVYFLMACKEWQPTNMFSNTTLQYIEAV